jgi:Gpi18-like mannosyltransferase
MIFLRGSYLPTRSIPTASAICTTTSPVSNPPLMAYLAEAMRWLAETTGLAFSFCFKLPGIFADVGTAIVLRIAGSRLAGEPQGALAFALYAWSLDAILVSGYHGNTDALVAFFSILASMLVLDRRHDFAGGLALAMAINVKLVPVLLVPALLAHQRSLAGLRRFCVGLSLGVIPFVPILMTSAMSFYQKAIGTTRTSTIGVSRSQSTGRGHGRCCSR